jgi:hypothetical protein
MGVMDIGGMEIGPPAPARFCGAIVDRAIVGFTIVMGQAPTPPPVIHPDSVSASVAVAP